MSAALDVDPTARRSFSIGTPPIVEDNTSASLCVSDEVEEHLLPPLDSLQDLPIDPLVENKHSAPDSPFPTSWWTLDVIGDTSDADVANEKIVFLEDKIELLENDFQVMLANRRGLGLPNDCGQVAFNIACSREVRVEAASLIQAQWRKRTLAHSKNQAKLDVACFTNCTSFSVTVG